MPTKAEADKRLFNLLFEIIMPKIYQLQESPLETEQAQAVNIANALYRLYGAIVNGCLKARKNGAVYC